MSPRPAGAFRRLAVATAVLVYLLIIMGGIVRVTGSGLGCADSWPSCNGSLLPAFNPNSIIEFLHRFISVLAGIAIVSLTLSTWIWEGRHRRLAVAAGVAAFLYLLQAALGALVVKYNLPGGIVMVHLANALLLLGTLVYIAVQSTAGPTAAAVITRRSAPLTAVAAGATYVLALSGAFVVENGAGIACNGWPLCGGGFQLPTGELAVINSAHRVVALLVVLLIALTMLALLRRHRGDSALRAGALTVVGLILLQIPAGALVVVLGLPAPVRALHLSLASALWATVLGVAVLTRIRERSVSPAPESTRVADALVARREMAAS
ncbi:MAG: COX15/CtaA family protein [Candidatus Dormibacteraeota bacterium]|nr:COX15/CtaA family protein [Candidatus Dormibacteraeota bacterium]MBV9526249.1 COX15/CtaA family protein [Candidatus Dormibacteraeota bacterium]